MAKDEPIEAYEHADLEFHVGPYIFKNFRDAAREALCRALTGRTALIDVVTWTRGAAVAWQGEDGGDSYDEDPEASVFERIEVGANSLARVP